MEEDITDLVTQGKLSALIVALVKLYAKGFRKIYFDGYEASIHLYKD